MAISFIQMAYNLVDILWIGRLGSESVAAVGSVGMLMWMMNSVALISKVGAEISIGQSLGARRLDQASVYASHTTTIAILLGLVFGILFFLFPQPYVSFYELKSEIAADAEAYLRVISLGIPIMFLVLNFSGIYIGAGRSDLPFYFNATGLVLNILLDPLLIFGWGVIPALGVRGAALATLLSQGLVLLLFIRHLKKQGGLLGRFPFLVRPRRRYTLNIFKLGLPVAAMNVYFAFINMNLARVASLYGGHLGITTPESDPMKFLSNEWQILSNPKTPTSPSSHPRNTIDYILGYTTNRQTYARHNARVIDERVASDHLPLFVDIRLKTPASEVMRTIPYLQNPGTDEMTVMWLTNVPTRSWVEYGTDPNALQRARTFIEGEMVANNKIHRVHLSNLQPGTRYYYRVVSQEITRYSSYYKEFGDTVRSDIKSFTTWSDDIQDFRVIVYNDLHSNMGMFNKLHSLVEDKPYDLVIFNGDCFDDVEVEEDILNRLLTYTPRIKSDEVPSIFIRGNHETRGEYSLHLWDYLGRMDGRSYSAFSMGDTRFVLLDCGEDKPDDHWVYYDMNDFAQHRINQAEFLKKELKSREFKRANKRILIHHIPIFGVNPDSFSPCSDLWIPVLKGVPFNVSLNAHTHRYRVIEKGEDGNHFPVIIGGGNSEPDGTVMVLEKKGDRLTLEVINAAGEILLKREL